MFGWKIQKWEGPIDYWLVATGDTSTPVINGGLMPTGEDFLGTVNTIEVGDIDAAIAIVKAHDGTLTLAKNAIPGADYQAFFRDNAGISLNCFWQLCLEQLCIMLALTE